MMKTHSIIFVLILLSGLKITAQDIALEYVNNWNQWRGPYETGVAPQGNPPLEWSETKNIKWKTPIPGKGHATPIIWGDQLILLSAVPTDEKAELPSSNEEDQSSWMNPVSTDLIHRFVVISVDRNTGKILWETEVRKELPASSTHEFGSWASNSPITDGERIYAYFGTMGLYCLNFSGEILWEHDFGKMEKAMSFGEGSSPTLYKDKLIILRDHEGPSSIHVLNKLNGEILWEADRDEGSSWSSPSVIEHNGSPQLITSATNKIRSYDLLTGKILWECTGLTRNVIPSPVHMDGTVYFMSGFRGNAMLAIDLDKASGDITGAEAVIWTYEQNTPYTPCPVLVNEKLYFLRGNNGFLSCLDAINGTPYYEAVKLEGIGNLFTSPIAVADRLYILGTKGTTCVVKQGDEFELLKANTLHDNFFASPIILGDALYLKGDSTLYCIQRD